MGNYPVIKTFIHNNNCYYYDYLSNFIYHIDKDHYRELQLASKNWVRKLP